MSEGFFSRWSRRKQAVEKGAELPEDKPEAEAPAPVEAQPEPAPALVAEAPEPKAEPEFDLSQLPPIESLTAESDFSLFMKPGVPAALRSAALRKAWVSDAAIRDYVSPLDYGWDFTKPDTIPGFSLDLGEVGEKLRQLVNQAIGAATEEPEQPEEPGQPLLAEAPPAAALEQPAAPEQPVAEAAPPEPPATRRRHGGALPG
jgi:hypothetical protein